MSDKSDDLIISISTDLATVRRSLKRLETDIGSSSKVIEKQFDGLGKNIDASLTRSFSRSSAAMARFASAGNDASLKIAKIFAFGASLKGAQDLIDSSIKVQNSLKVTGLEGENLKKVYDALFASAQKNGAPLDSLATLYGRTASAAKDLGASQDDLLKFTDKISLALRVSGQSAAESSGALLQLSQALGDGVIQAQEYNSLLDAGRPILQAVAAGMKEAGGSVGKLTSLVKDGKISSKAFFDAFLAGSPMLEKAVASSEQTISSRFQKLQNALIDLAGRFDSSAESSKTFGTAIDTISSEIMKFDVGNFLTQMDYIIKKFEDAKSTGMGFADWIGSKTGLGKIGDALPKGGIDVFGGTPLAGQLVISGTHNTPDKIALDNTQKRLDLEKKIKELRDDPASTGSPLIQREIAMNQAQLDTLPKEPFKYPAFPHSIAPRVVGPADPGKGLAPISINDPQYVPVDPKKIQEAKDAYDALIKSADDRIGQMKQEVDLTGKVGIEQDTARFALDLLQKSEDKGRTLDDAQKKALQDKVDLYKQYAETLAKAKLGQDLLTELRDNSMSTRDQAIVQMQRQYGLPEDPKSATGKQIGQSYDQKELSGGIKTFFTDIEGGLETKGKKIGEVLGDAVKNAAQNAMNKALDSLFGQFANGLASILTGGKNQATGVAGSAASAVGAAIVGKSAAAVTAPAVTGSMSAYAKAIQSVESHGDYSALGPVMKSGDRAYGAYQVMGSNVPSWTKDATGTALTPSAFLNDKSAQDAVFTKQFGASVSKYGNPQDAASVWFSGRPMAQAGNASDGFNTTPEYVTKFNTALGGASKNVDQFGGGLGKLGSTLASGATGGGGGSSWLSLLSGSIFSGSKQLAASGGIGLFADGGHVTGPGSPTSDSIPTMLSNGEYVINAASTKKHRALIEAINTGKVRHFADGGFVSPQMVSAPTGPSLIPRASAANNNSQPGVLQVQIHGASGDDHVRQLVKQGVGDGLTQYGQQQRRGGFGDTQTRWTNQKG